MIRIESHKTQNKAFLPLVEPTKGMIRHRLQSLKISKDTPFLAYNINYIRKVFAKYRKKANLEEVYSTSKNGRNLYVFTTHVLRATAITEFYRNTKDPVKTMKFARHKKMESTMVYIRLVKEEIAQNMEDTFV